MTEAQRRKVITYLTHQPHQKKSGEITLLFFSKIALQKRAFRFGGLMVSLAIASIFVPIAHFFLVPFFLIATPILYFWILGKESWLQEGTATCPACEGMVKIESGTAVFPKTEKCEHCKCDFKVDLEA